MTLGWLWRGTGDLGRDGEAAARRYLERRGYLTLAERFRCRQGEIDLVMLDGQAVVFVEVKTRRGARAGEPEEAVTEERQRRLAAAGRVFLQRGRLSHRPHRWDVVAVRWDRWRPRFHHLRGVGSGERTAPMSSRG